MALPAKVTGYRFLDKDPVIDVYRTARERTGMTFAQIALKSGVTEATLRAWDYGATKRPQHLTLRFAMDAMGYKETWVNGEGRPLAANYRRSAQVITLPKKKQRA